MSTLIQLLVANLNDVSNCQWCLCLWISFCVVLKIRFAVCIYILFLENCIYVTCHFVHYTKVFLFLQLKDDFVAPVLWLWKIKVHNLKLSFWLNINYFVKICTLICFMIFYFVCKPSPFYFSNTHVQEVYSSLVATVQ